MNLIDYFSDRQDSILDIIRLLVELESTSREPGRLDEIARVVANLAAPFADEIDLLPASEFGTHLSAKFFGSSQTKHLLIIGHLDTVWPVGTLERIPFRITAEGRAYGPGIFDMKSGVVIALEAIRSLRDLQIPTRRPVRLLLTCDEEIGSRSSRVLIEEAAINAEAALVLEPPIPGGIVKTARKGVGVFSVRAIGRAAHAGLDPARGVNAIVELAHQVLRLAALNDFSRGTTVSVGVVRGGTTSNVVPAEATAKVDVRFTNDAEGARIEEAIRSIQPVLPESRLEITGGLNRPPMMRTAGNAELFGKARSLAAELGFGLEEGSVGGGSDGNFTSALGVPTLDGLGVDGAGAHADHEHIIISDIPRRAALLARLIETV
jgi:glutamate carboxypeptidase